MRTIASILAAAATLAVAAAPAQAYTQADLDQAVPTARAVWPGSPCAGHENVVQTEDLANGESAGAEAVLDGTCTVRVRPSYGDGAYTLCLVLAHEFGHLAGHEHSEGGIMESTVLPLKYGNGSYAPCALLYVPLRTPAAYTVRSLAADTAHTTERACRLVALKRRPGTSVRRYRCGARAVRVVNHHGVISADRIADRI